MDGLRPARERGQADFGWLQSRHSFSFGDYHDPAHMGFGALRVINEDRVAPGAGFGAHGHADMEIISYVIDGGLAHKDSLGSGTVIRPGDVQRMSAGTGIRHSEFNASDSEPVHFLQIWIVPERPGLTPGYQQTHFPIAERSGRLRLVGARDGRDGAVTIHQDVDLYSATLNDAQTVVHTLKPGRAAWVQLVRGTVNLNGQTLRAGDGIGICEPPTLAFTDAAKDAEFLLFDLVAPFTAK